MSDNVDIPHAARSRFLYLELFVAFSLFVAYFFLVRSFFVYGDPMNSNIFIAGSEKLYQSNQPFMTEHWNARLTGVLLTGALMDYALDGNSSDQAQLDRLMDTFGLYHASWLLLLFVCLVFALRYSLFINLGIFAGLMYDFSPTSGPYFYPWDMPAMVFFTLAALFFERRQTWLAVALVCAGAFFKETILVCGLLVFFAHHWKWKKRILVFISLVAVYVLGKEWMVRELGVQAAMFSVNNALYFHGPFNPLTLLYNFTQNLKALFTLKLNSVIFVNAGTLVAVLILGWRMRRLWPYLTVITAFIVGMFLLNPPPGIREIRVFVDVLPLSVILLSVWWTESSGISATSMTSMENAPAWPTRETFRLLMPIVITVVALFVSIVAFQYYIIFEDLQPKHQAQSQLGMDIGKFEGVKSATLETFAGFFQDGYVDAELKLAINAQKNYHDADAIPHYQRALQADTNSIYALNNLALLLATDSDARLRDGQRAVPLAEQACQITQYQNPIIIYTLASAYAEAGRFNDAVAAGEKARAVALAQGQTGLAQENEAVLELYKSGKPFHQQPPPAGP